MRILVRMARFIAIDLVTRRHIVVSGWTLLDASHVATIELGSPAIRCLELPPLTGAIDSNGGTHVAVKLAKN